MLAARGVKTADELDELPDEVRPHVARLLGRGFGGAWGRVKVLEGPKVEMKPVPHGRVIIPQDQMRRQMDEQIEQLNKRLEEMNQRMSEMMAEEA